MAKKITVIQENNTGRNIKFKDPNGKVMTRAELVKEIKSGSQEGYHVRKINGVNTPCSNPDGKKNNNLG